MMMKAIRCQTVFVVVLLISVLSSEAQWIQSARSDQVAYFLFGALPRVERYSFTNGQWLSPLALPSVYGPPTTFHVDSDGLYVAYGQSVKRYRLNGSNESHLINTAETVQGIFTDGNLILINRSSSLYARLTSLDKTTGTVIAEFENYIDAVSGASIAPSINKIFGRSLGVSPSDITYVSYNDDGTFITGGDSPHHGDYPGASRTWVFPGDAKVVDDSGTVYSTGDLTYLNSFGSTINDLDFFGPDVPIVLHGSQLTAYSNALLPTGSRTLAFTPKNVYVTGTNVMTFTPDAAEPNGVRVDAVPISTLNPPTPGLPVDPHGLAYTPDDAFLDVGGILYLFSKAHQSLFRWDTGNQEYLASIPLVGAPNYVAYSPTNHAVYLAYSSGLIRQIDLTSTNLGETPFAMLATAPLGLATADAYVFAMDGSGAWGTHYTFAASGVKVESVDWNYYSLEFIWSSPNQKMYFFRDDTSPNDLLWEQINANGLAYPGEPPGGIGIYMDSPLHDSSGFVHPIRVAPDGSIVVLGSGVIHDANSLARLPVSLANRIADAAWVDGQLRTMRTISDLTQFQEWNLPDYGLGAVRQLPGLAHRLFQLHADQLLGITVQAGEPTFYVMDGRFHVIAPPTLLPPDHVAARIVSSSQVAFTWNDVSGEEDYSIQRRTGASGSWAEIGTATTSSTNFHDGSVVVGNVYSYCVISRNGSQTSVPSAEVSAALVVPETPTNVMAVKLSSNAIMVTWMDVLYESNHLLERKTGAAGGWTQIIALPADTVTYTDSGLTPNTEYFYRLRSTNGIGSSAYSAVASAITDPVPPTSPTLTSATASGPFTINLVWSNSSYEDNYVIERRTGSDGVWNLLTVVSRDVTSYLDNTVSPLTAYEYRLYATNALGASAYSNVRSVTTPQVPPPPAPAGLVAKPLSRSSALVRWNDVSFETGYRLERRNENPTSWVAIATLAADTTSYTDTNLLEGVQYFYRVQAFNDFGGSPYSNEDDAVPADIVNLIEDDFDPGLETGVWATISGGATTNGGQGFRGSKALWFGASGLRSATTIPLDLTLGGYVEFALRGGNESVDGNTFWNNSESDENVVLEFSTDGVVWSLLQSLNTVYPSLSTWSSFSLPVPASAATLHVQFRWRQLKNSGAGYDAWALDDVRVVGAAPGPPTAPPFIISSPASATSVAVFWIDSDGATSYVIERRLGIAAWAPLATLPASVTYYTDDTALPATAYSYRVQAVNAGGVSPYSPVTTSVTFGQLEEWLLVNYGSPDALTVEAMHVAAPDGTRPLLRYAFNLTANEPARTLVPGNSSSGFPAVWLDAARNRLCVEYLCRKASANPEIVYQVRFSSDLSQWDSTGIEVSTYSIDSLWERVRCEDTVSTDQARMRFCRVSVGWR